MTDEQTTDQKRAVRGGYDELADEYDARRGDDPAFLDEFRERLPADARVLDAGCGAGRPVAASLTGDSGTASGSDRNPASDSALDLVGVDISREQVRLAREHVPRGRFAQADMTRLPLADDSVDGVVAYHSVIHVPADEHPAVAREFARVLRPGGHLLLTVGSETWKGSNDDWLDTGVEMRWSVPGPDESASTLDAAGFEVVWRRVVDDSLGGDACFVLARKSDGE